MSTPDLFTRQPLGEPREYAARICPNTTLVRGEKLGIQLQNDRIVARKGIDIVAEFQAPPAELLDALKKSHGEASGTVQEVYDIAETAEITVC